MSDQYWVTKLIKVDRGMIPDGTTKNGKEVLGKHIPYYAGLLLRNARSFNLEFLDEYNSEIFFKSLLKFRYQDINRMTFTQMIYTYNEFFSSNLDTIVVNDLEDFLKEHKIRKAPRNPARMNSLANRASLSN